MIRRTGKPERNDDSMQIQLNTDRSVNGTDALRAQVEETVGRALRRFEGQVTRVEAHLSDENHEKFGATDKRCALEARPTGLQPIAVTHQAATLDQAIEGAAGKLRRALETAFGKLGRS
jgi:ribosome-associated translation inhibitor RaiA